MRENPRGLETEISKFHWISIASWKSLSKYSEWIRLARNLKGNIVRESLGAIEMSCQRRRQRDKNEKRVHKAPENAKN